MNYHVNSSVKKPLLVDFSIRRYRFTLPFYVAMVYLVFGIIWILSTDWLALRFFSGNTDMLRDVMSAKGLIFIGFSAIIIYVTTVRLYRHLKLSINDKDEALTRYEALNAASREAVFEHDFEQAATVVNDHMKEIFGYEPQKIVDGWQLWNERVHPDDYERVLLSLTTAMQTGKATWNGEYQFYDAAGRVRDVRGSCYFIRNKDGKVLKMIGTLQDITEFKDLQKRYYEQSIKNKSTLMRSIIKAQENERQRWAHELHDNVCQMLMVSKLYLDTIPKELPTASARLLNDSKAVLSDAINEIRNLSAQLKPPTFNDSSLTEAIEKLFANINRVRNISFHIDAAGISNTEISEDQQLMIYRIIQEQLNNIVKYADCSNVNIELKARNDLVAVTIEDDGKGFDPSQVSAGIGLKNIKSRLAAFKGVMNIISAPGQGCKLEARFSL